MRKQKIINWETRDFDITTNSQNFIFIRWHEHSRDLNLVFHCAPVIHNATVILN